MKHLLTITMLLLGLTAVHGSAWADRETAPDRRDMRAIDSLAGDLERQAADLLRQVERTRPRNQYGPDRAYDLVRRFYFDTEAFAEVVDDNIRYPERTLVAYRRMHASYDRLFYRNEQSILGPRIGRYLVRVQETVGRLDGYYRRSGPQRVDWDRVAYLAHQMEILGARVYSQARAELQHGPNPPNDWRSRDILARLSELSEAAAHFHDQVEHGRRDPSHLQNDFNRLHAAQQAASTRIWSLEYRIRNDFYRLTDYMREVNRQFFDRRDDDHDDHDNHWGPGSDSRWEDDRPTFNRKPLSSDHE